MNAKLPTAGRSDNQSRSLLPSRKAVPCRASLSGEVRARAGLGGVLGRVLIVRELARNVRASARIGTPGPSVNRKLPVSGPTKPSSACCVPCWRALAQCCLPP
jgi:hypothetical protein